MDDDPRMQDPKMRDMIKAAQASGLWPGSEPPAPAAPVKTLAELVAEHRAEQAGQGGESGQ